MNLQTCAVQMRELKIEGSVSTQVLPLLELLSKRHVDKPAITVDRILYHTSGRAASGRFACNGVNHDIQQTAQNVSSQHTEWRNRADSSQAVRLRFPHRDA